MLRLRNLLYSLCCPSLPSPLAVICAISLCFPSGLFAQSAARPSAVDGVALRSLGPIDYVEIDTPSESGAGKRLIVFVHGTPGSYTAFRNYLNDPIMRDHFHMISVTRPGWRNDEDPKIPSLHQQAAALRPLLEMDRSGRGAILMGHSYGGPVIARTAMNYPDLVAGLAFVATTGDPQLSGPRWYNRFAVVLPRFLLGASLKGANAEIMPLRGQLEEMLPLWQELSMPVLIVQGRRDRLVHPDNALFLERVLSNAEVRLLDREGLGHFVLWEEAEMIRDNLIELFASADSGEVGASAN